MVELRTDLTPDLPDIRGSESEIRDALTNLIFNAVDAMPDGGVVEVRTNVTAPSPQDGASTRRVRLEVMDTGIGMDEDTRRRCLEPFFTTKGERGTGLGLAMVYGMAQRHSAALEIDSKPRVGTTMRLIFPTSTRNPASTGRLPALLMPGRSLRILIVDDDPALIESLQQALHDDGHEVSVAHGGQAGIDTFQRLQRTAKPFEVVITDLGMPYVDGRQVADAVRTTAPQTPIILLTGWGQQSTAESESLPRVDRLLSKPPRLRELRAALAELTSA
jgi:CheY-like chemotaxis protein